MSDLRDDPMDPTPWHQAGDVVAEVERLRELVGKLDAARADAELLHRGASRQLWDYRQEVDRLREEVDLLREKERTSRHRWADALRRIVWLEDAIIRHRDEVGDRTWLAADQQLWDVLEDDR